MERQNSVRDLRLLEYLVFLVAHGEFDGGGRLVGLRAEPRLRIEFRVWF